MQFILLVSFLASANALPLNINLGAYSPALVVGDGEISFGGNQDVSNLMNALEGAAVSGAAANGQAAPVRIHPGFFNVGTKPLDIGCLCRPSHCSCQFPSF